MDTAQQWQKHLDSNGNDDSSMSAGSEFEVIEQPTEDPEEPQLHQPAEEVEDGHQPVREAAMPNDILLELMLDIGGQRNMAVRISELEKQVLEMNVAKLEAEKSELKTKLEMMEMKANKSGEENEQLKRKLEDIEAAKRKLEEQNGRLGEQLQTVKESAAVDETVEKEQQLAAEIDVKIANLERQMVGVRSELKVFDRLQLQTTQLSMAVTTLETEGAQLRAQLQMVRKRPHDAANAKELQLQHQVTSLALEFTEQIEHLKANFASSTGEIRKRLDKLEMCQNEKQAAGVEEKQKQHCWELLENVSLITQSQDSAAISAGLRFGHGWHFGEDLFTVNKTDSIWGSAVAEYPFPVAAANPPVVHGPLLFYFEVHVIKLKSPLCVGLCDNNLLLDGDFVGNHACSFAIRCDGFFGASGAHWQGSHFPGGFDSGDVVGFGLLIRPAAERKKRIFFTKNGQIWGKQVLLNAKKVLADLYPAVSAFHAGNVVKINLGSPEPFRFGLTVNHLKQLLI